MVDIKQLESAAILNKMKEKQIALFFYVFLPVLLIYAAINAWMAQWTIAMVECLVFALGLSVFSIRHKLGNAVCSAVCAALFLILMGILLFIPSIGGVGYIWIFMAPFVVGYLTNAKAGLLWSVGFLVVSCLVGMVMFTNGHVLYYGWDKAIHLPAAFIVSGLFSYVILKFYEQQLNVLAVESVRSKQNEQGLAESEARYRVLLHSSLNGIGVHRHGEWVYVNPAALRMFGAKHFDDIKDIPVINFIHPDYRAMALERYAELKLNKGTVPLVEEKFVRLNGEYFHVEVSTAQLVFAGEPAIALTFKDVSERKTYEAEHQSLQQQLDHAQRLESLGLLAGGIAHDFNNLLAAIAGNAELAKLEVDETSKVNEYINNIDESCVHATDLCKQMLTYAGKGNYELKSVDLNKMVKSMGRLIRASVSNHIELKVKLSKTLSRVKGDAAQLSQVVLNLIVNAADAIGDNNGRLYIKTYETQVTRGMAAKFFNGKALDALPYVVLEVSDNGCGMSKAIQGKIFDPFFTTKEKGNGLGLSAMLGTIRGHQGAVDLQSSPGKGTVFRVFLPLDERYLGTTGNLVETTEIGAWQGDGLVLIVDDDETVRDVATAFVQQMQFEPILADNGRVGVDLFKQYHDKIKAVLLDMTMPVLGGLDAMREMREINKDVPIIIMSGYSEEAAGIHATDKPNGFLQKPFRLKTMKKILYKQTEKKLDDT